MEKQSRKISLSNIFHFNRKNVRKKSELEYERKTDKELLPCADSSCNLENKNTNNNVTTRTGLERQKFNSRDSLEKQTISLKVKNKNELPDLKTQSSNSSKESFDKNGFFSRYQSKSHKLTYKSKKFSYIRRNSSSDRSIGGAIKFIDSKLRYIVLTPSFPRNSYIPLDSTTHKNNEGSSNKSQTDFKQNLNMFDFHTKQYHETENKIYWKKQGTGDSSASEENSYHEFRDQAHNTNMSVQCNSNLNFGNYLSNDNNSSITSEKVTINPSRVDKTSGDKTSRDNYRIVFKDNHHQVSLDSAAHDMKDVHIGSSEIQQRTNIKENFELSHFSILKTLGTGTFGRVFLAKSSENGQFYAMKIMKIADIIKLNQREHVNNEKNILEKIEHPFIVKCIWTCHNNLCLYMLLEFIPGGELFSYLRNQEKFPVDDTLFYVAEIIIVFEYLHKNKIVYRDLKPENLLINKDGHIVFTDFGFAKELNVGITYTLCGTPEYISPEVIQGKGHDFSCDWWALGILTYEMLTGAPPFVDDQPFGLYQKILSGDISWDDFPPHEQSKNFVQKLLTADRNERIGKGESGTKEIKRQSWVCDVNWDDVWNKKLDPPIIPITTSNDDTANFDDFDETWEPYSGVPSHSEVKFFESWEAQQDEINIGYLEDI